MSDTRSHDVIMPGLAVLADDAPDGLPEAPRQAPLVPWTTRLWISFDVAVQRKSPWVSMTVGAFILASILLMAGVRMLLAGASLQVVYAALMTFVAVVWWLTGWIADGFIYRRHKRPARADEVAALRGHARPGTWPCVRAAAADWQRSAPRYPITIAVILNWEDEAVRKVRAAMPPTIAEQAAAKAQARAFE